MAYMAIEDTKVTVEEVCKAISLLTWQDMEILASYLDNRIDRTEIKSLDPMGKLIDAKRGLVTGAVLFNAIDSILKTAPEDSGLF